ncbi:uncharacterized protein BKCO1_1000492 [Diplodia corticola]|uniref:G-protein coupled receptors family 2 profile 2 domain-containing protein n=1 Tax=Diplodia corticola TaxID=236234 RepID=A0A1J9S5R7_9PEZI|nr:uncharacterized protein BKCO1_1000492 [Diplodia corticola]OJD40299.1 hypothetical protein BKCO1_1000492 [Diplodia corticola]
MTSPFNGACPAPFLDESLFPKSGGFVPGRACALNPLEGPNATSRCCIPCPIFDYVYDDDFKNLTDGAAWLHVVGFILCGFLLISMAVLPVTATRRTFLNIILLVGIMLLELGFIIPLARQPEQCHNEITPNDMNTSTTCAFSGAFAAFGGMTLVTWILIRAFFMHLQIVWDHTPTKYTYLAANITAWTVTIVLVSAVLAHAGVSFRFGGYCHVNHTGSIPTYWSWLLAFGALALLLQLATFAYCIKVYLQATLVRSAAHTTPSSHSTTTTTHKPRQPSTTTTTTTTTTTSLARARARTATARAALHRINLVLALQWRSLLIVFLAIFTTAFVCVVFIVLDNAQEKLALANADAALPWIACIILTRDNDACVRHTAPIVISQRVTVATLFVLAAVGCEAFGLLWRGGVGRAWVGVVRGAWGRRGEVRGWRRWGRWGRRRDYLMGGPEPAFDLVGRREGAGVAGGRGERLGSAGGTVSPMQRGVVAPGERVVEEESSVEKGSLTAATEAPHAL